ncbi:MAG: hypothetical protein FWG96_05830 [Methanomassiliicoccaceae archaeon]|nr:hypothetical protein [Methanomassiliicoccaceae archaeon]
MGKKFLEKLGYVEELTLLNYIRNELKQTRNKLNKLTTEINNKGGFNAFTFSIYSDLQIYFTLLRERNRLERELFRLKIEFSPWFYVSGGYVSLDGAVSASKLK